MNIVFVIDEFGKSGNGTSISALRMAENLRERGHRVRVVSGTAPGEDNVYLTGIKRYPLLYRLCKAQGMFLAKADEDVLKEAFEDADVVHYFLPFALCRRGKRIADAMGIPSTAAFHVQPENITSTLYLNRLQPINEWLYSKFRGFFDQFDHVHCPSEMIKDQLRSRYYRAKMHVISNGVSPEFRPKTVLKPQAFQGKTVALMVGRLSREKRQDLILKAVAKSPYQQDIQVVFAGRGPWRKKLEKMGKRLHNAPKFLYCTQEELIDLMNVADLYIHASDIEIEAISCIEAFSCGLVPIISDSPVSATNQFALSEDNLFQAGNSDDLEAKMRHLLENPKKKAALSKYYLKYAQNFRVKESVDKFENMLEEAIALYEGEKKTSPVRDA